jgi:hypothetical protein
LLFVVVYSIANLLNIAVFFCIIWHFWINFLINRCLFKRSWDYSLFLIVRIFDRLEFWAAWEYWRDISHIQFINKWFISLFLIHNGHNWRWSLDDYLAFNSNGGKIYSLNSSICLGKKILAYLRLDWHSWYINLLVQFSRIKDIIFKKGLEVVWDCETRSVRIFLYIAKRLFD